MSQYKCEDCNDSGKLLTESITFSRPYMYNGRLSSEVIGHDNWENTQCHCVGEDD